MPRKHSVKTPSNMGFFTPKKCLTRNPKCTHGKAYQVKDLDTYGLIQKNPYVAWLYVGMSKCLFSTDRVFKLGFSLVFGADFNRKRLLVIFLLPHRNSKRFRSLWITQRRLLNCLRRNKRRVTGQNVISCSSRRMLVSGWKKACLFILACRRVGSAKRVAECELNSRGAIPAWLSIGVSIDPRIIRGSTNRCQALL
jgi:hypothetical protein